jgi:hypothetical protein
MDLIALPYLEDYVAAHPLLKPDMSREAFLTYLPIAVLYASIAQLDAFADTEGLDAKTKKWVHQVSQARSNSAHDWQLFSGTFNGAMFIAQPETVFFKGVAAGILTVKGLGRAASWGGSIARLGDDAVEMGLVAKTLPGPTLPTKIADTFADSAYVNRQLAEDARFFKFHGLDNRTGRKFSWVTDQKYASEAELRSALAIREDWGVKITHVSEYNVPKGTWISEGLAAPQGVGYPGRAYQGVLQNVPRSWIIRTNAAFP